MSDDLAVDVLIIGGGIQAHYLARQLSDDYSVCVLVDPSLREESLEAEGYMSAGYDGNDANRIQPARRAAGYWKLWAESNDLVHDETDPLFTVATDDLSTIPRLWSDASLVHVPVASPTTRPSSSSTSSSPTGRGRCRSFPGTPSSPPVDSTPGSCRRWPFGSGM